MPGLPLLFRSFHGLFAAAAAVALVLAAASGTASAQGVVALVNGDAITNSDVAQRTRLIQISGQRPPTRKEVVQELIDERLKIQLLKRFAIPGIDKDVDNAFTGMARRAGMSAKEFTQQLARANVNARTLRERIRADIIWNQVVRSRYQSSFQFSDRDIRTQLEASHPDAATITGFDYTLRPIVFVVPRGASDAVRANRRREAEALRGRFQNCEQGVQLARTLREVAVRPPVVRSSADIPPQLRSILEKTPVGRLSAPETTAQGIEVYALCDRKPSTAADAPERRAIRDQLAAKQFDEKSEAFLRELRSQALIEYR